MKRFIGAHGARETPVPMPNTAVKPSSGYNTWPIKAWENSTVPNYIKDLRIGGLLSFWLILLHYIVTSLRCSFIVCYIRFTPLRTSFAYCTQTKPKTVHIRAIFP